ncbi:hypothetical protein BIFGAL_04093 [Bifidobacterium gallicum DSM 20093 = LMG 11596]|uniref:Uncharacterized protein n=1 Tax=Bifidobacterium gallicum DSM 20093 = LMG 11596 TaxID=561180 RepID=D1NW48_9BIFI|nr:hypothetical protein BIFGAL_04093 [Bifidobacterium gallicum DSM 20093 = LMG 11596]
MLTSLVRRGAVCCRAGGCRQPRVSERPLPRVFVSCVRRVRFVCRVCRVHRLRSFAAIGGGTLGVGAYDGTRL